MFAKLEHARNLNANAVTGKTGIALGRAEALARVAHPSGPTLVNEVQLSNPSDRWLELDVQAIQRTRATERGTQEQLGSTTDAKKPIIVAIERQTSNRKPEKLETHPGPP